MTALPSENEPELCPTRLPDGQVCGEPMVTQDGETYCPKCSAQIDWGLEDDSVGEEAGAE